MSIYWRKVGAYFMPPAAALTLLWGAFFAFAVFSLLVGVVSLANGDLNIALALMSCLGLPGLAGLVFIAILLPMRSGLRAALFAMMTMILTLAMSGQVLAMAETKGIDPASIACCLAPLLLTTIIPGLVFTRKALPEVHQVLRAARAQRVVEIVHAHGDPTLAGLAVELKLSEAQAASLVEELQQSGALMGSLDREMNRFYSAACLAEKQRRLLAMIQAHGKLSLEEAAAGLKVSPRQIHTWIYGLVQRGQFHGCVDWEKQVVYALEANRQQAAERCPQCGGELDVAGQGLIHCRHCGVEIFL